jgi:hypothetical protein
MVERPTPDVPVAESGQQDFFPPEISSGKSRSKEDFLPELAPYRPPRRKLWMSEDDRMAIFDAAALAATFFVWCA